MKVQCDNCGKEFSDTINNGIILPIKNKQTMNLCRDCFFYLGKSSEREKAELVKKLSKKFNIEEADEDGKRYLSGGDKYVREAMKHWRYWEDKE